MGGKLIIPTTDFVHFFGWFGWMEVGDPRRQSQLINQLLINQLLGNSAVGILLHPPTPPD
jgi:hypothetical protein